MKFDAFMLQIIHLSKKIAAEEIKKNCPQFDYLNALV